jgi:hypothetical protein
MPIPPHIAKKLEAYPAIAQTMALVYDKPSLPTGYEPKFVEVFCDQKLAVQWVDGYLTHQLYVPEDYKPKTIEWAIDGEMVCVLVEGETLLDRLENPIAMP